MLQNGQYRKLAGPHGRVGEICAAADISDRPSVATSAGTVYPKRDGPMMLVVYQDRKSFAWFHDEFKRTFELVEEYGE